MFDDLDSALNYRSEMRDWRMDGQRGRGGGRMCNDKGQATALAARLCCVPMMKVSRVCGDFEVETSVRSLTRPSLIPKLK